MDRKACFTILKTDRHSFKSSTTQRNEPNEKWIDWSRKLIPEREKDQLALERNLTVKQVKDN